MTVPDRIVSLAIALSLLLLLAPAPNRPIRRVMTVTAYVIGIGGGLCALLLS